MLYTDGANEARSATGQLYGDARLLNTASRLSPGDSPDFILHSIDRFAGTQPQSDDITVVLVRVGG
jgi:serine phosphatase RsbU (regulator of sigma subunit)